MSLTNVQGTREAIELQNQGLIKKTDRYEQLACGSLFVGGVLFTARGVLEGNSTNVILGGLTAAASGTIYVVCQEMKKKRWESTTTNTLEQVRESLASIINKICKSILNN